MSAIYCHGEDQERLARASRDRHAVKLSSEIHTEIAPLGIFHLAEDYHQKYRLRRAEEIMAEFEVMYPDSREFIASTAAARVNGYLGRGTVEALAKEIEGFGLSAKGQRALLRRVETRR